MELIPAAEIRRRGLSALDKRLQHGPVHVVKHDRLRYVILSEAHYQELVEAQLEAERARIKEALADAEAGRVRRLPADELIARLELDT